jgi:hypothetical protein
MTSIVIPFSEAWAEIASAVFLLLIGVRLLWFRPRSIQRKIDNGKISEEAGEAALKRIPSKQGYLFIIMAIGLTFVALWDKDVFGHSSCSR